MTKQSGLGASLFVAEFDISGDVGAVTSIVTSRNPLIVTGIDKSAPERILGTRDGEIAFMSFWNVSAGQAEAVLSTLPRTDRIISTFIGATVGYPAVSMTGKQMTFGPNRTQDGSLISSTNAKANGFGLDWGEMLTVGKESFATGTVSGTSIDGGASSAFGAAAFIHVFSVASGTATFTVQDSADNAAFATLTGLDFTAATGATSERKATASGATVRRYVRIQGTGVHGAAVVAVNFVRYTEAL